MGAKSDKMDAIKAEYREWLRYPDVAARKKAGVPTSKSAFAKKHKIDRSTIWTWEQDPEFVRETYNSNLGAITIDDANRIIEGLKAKAFEGNVQAAKLLLEWAGLYGKNAIPPEGSNSKEDYEAALDDMDDEQLEAFIAKNSPPGEDDDGCLSTQQSN